jgi:hypothetical protein
VAVDDRAGFAESDTAAVEVRDREFAADEALELDAARDKVAAVFMRGERRVERFADFRLDRCQRAARQARGERAHAKGVTVALESLACEGSHRLQRPRGFARARCDPDLVENSDTSLRLWPQRPQRGRDAWAAIAPTSPSLVTPATRVTRRPAISETSASGPVAASGVSAPTRITASTRKSVSDRRQHPYRSITAVTR